MDEKRIAEIREHCEKVINAFQQILEQLEQAQKEIDNAPTIYAVPVVRGEWNPIFKGADTCECSVCKSKGFSDSDFGFIATPYCPNCGARMDGDKHE